jgi:hypothetical protein
LTKTNALSSFAQQYMNIKATGNNDPNPRQQVLDDVENHIPTTKSTDYIMIGIDANETINGTTTGILQFVTNNQLTDTYAYLHNNSNSQHILMEPI